MQRPFPGQTSVANPTRCTLPGVTSKRRYLVLALPLALAACGTAAGPAPAPAPSRTTVNPPGALTANGGGGGFTLDEGMEHDACGIGVVLKFIPSSASAAKADEAVLMGGPVNKVPDKIQDHTGADPLPDNAARATPGTVVTVVGKRFRVNAVDATSGRAQLEPLC
jgi:hypothetical protein